MSGLGGPELLFLIGLAILTAGGYTAWTLGRGPWQRRALRSSLVVLTIVYFAGVGPQTEDGTPLSSLSGLAILIIGVYLVATRRRTSGNETVSRPRTGRLSLVQWLTAAMVVEGAVGLLSLGALVNELDYAASHPRSELTGQLQMLSLGLFLLAASVLGATWAGRRYVVDLMVEAVPARPASWTCRCDEQNPAARSFCRRCGTERNRVSPPS